MIPSDTRLALIDHATDMLGDRLSPATLSLFVRHLRRMDIDLYDWHRCADIAASGPLTHHQARTAAGQLVRCGLLERDVVQHRVRRQDSRYTVYRLPPAAPEGAVK
ncbi:hypothetical protein ACWDZ4_20690 [Streptomyces sp. NPDC003016]